MKAIRRTSQFKLDVKLMQRRGNDLAKLKRVLASLAMGEVLAAKYRDRVLVGQYRGTRECHMEADWLLIYESAESEIILIRTGSHSDLFQ
jgi:mRNA interferase YafQ